LPAPKLENKRLESRKNIKITKLQNKIYKNGPNIDGKTFSRRPKPKEIVQYNFNISEAHAIN